MVTSQSNIRFGAARHVVMFSGPGTTPACVLMHLVINWFKVRVRAQGVHALRYSYLQWVSYTTFQGAFIWMR